MLSSPEQNHHSIEKVIKASKPIDAENRALILDSISKEEQNANDSDELAELGVSMQEAFSDEESSALLAEKGNNVKAIETDKSIQNQFIELKKTGKSVASILATLKTEFATAMDKEASDVLNKYSALLSPALISDKKELEAVETLFYTQSCDFSAKSFTGFVQTIYDEPDSIISEETKQKIEREFRIPRMVVNTGADLAKATTLKDPAGKTVFNSPNNALAFRPGVKTYMKDGNNAVLLIKGNSQSEPLSIPSKMLLNSKAIAKLSNYALIRQMLYEEMGQLTNLFGGGAEDELGQPSEETIKRSNRFAESLIGAYPPQTILGAVQLSKLRLSFKALRSPSKMGKTESLNSMQELGLLDNGDIRWNQLQHIGATLQANEYFKTFEIAKEGEAHRLLLAKIKHTMRNGYLQESKMSDFNIVGHFSFHSRFKHLSSLLLSNIFKMTQHATSRHQKYTRLDPFPSLLGS